MGRFVWGWDRVGVWWVVDFGFLGWYLFEVLVDRL